PHVLEIGNRATIIGDDGGMPAEAEDFIQEFGAKAIHYRHDDDEGRDAERNSEEGEDGDNGNEAFAALGAQVAHGQHPFESRKRPRVGERLAHQALKRPATWSSGTFCLSPDLRFLSSATPSLMPRGPIMTCQGKPMRSIVANFAPGRSSVS